MNALVSVARWVAFIPTAIIGYVIGTWAVFFGISYATPEVASAVRYAPDFAGHIFYGPFIVFFWFSVATAMAVYAGIYVAPSHKKTAASLLGLLVTAFIGTAIFGIIVSPDRHLITWQMWLRTSIELVGMIIGFFAGIMLVYENGEFASAD